MEIIVLFITFFLLSAYFSSIETAFTSLTKLQLQQLQLQEKKGWLIVKLMKHPDRLLTTILIGNNIANVTCSTLASIFTYQVGGSAFISLSTGLVIFLLVLFCELIPKRISLFYNTIVITKTIYLTYFFVILLQPLQKFIYQLAQGFTFFLTIPNDKEFVSLESLRSFLTIAKSTGFFNQWEYRILDNLSRIKANNTTAQQVLTHRKNLYMLDATQTIGAKKDQILAIPFNRIPIYRGDNKDLITGFVLKTELLVDLERHPERFIESFQHPLIVVPTSQNIYALFPIMRKYKASILGALNEYGEIVGIITLHDLMEELIGSLYGEQDIIPLAGGRYQLSGQLPLGEFNQYFQTTLKPKSYKTTTIGGYLVEQLGKIPVEEEQISISTGNFLIKETRNNRIELLCYTPSQSATST